MLICTSCRTKFLSGDIKTRHTPKGQPYKMCPIIPCHGSVVNIDDALVHILSHFWKIKIQTQHSCGGHIWEWAMTPYVLFSFENRRRHGVSQKTFDARLERFHKLYAIADKAWMDFPGSPYYDVDIGKIQELPEYSAHALTQPGPCLRFNVSARNLVGGHVALIETQGAFLKLLYDIHSKMVLWDRRQKEKRKKK